MVIVVFLLEVLSWFLSDLKGVDLIFGVMKRFLVDGGWRYVSWLL